MERGPTSAMARRGASRAELAKRKIESLYKTWTKEREELAIRLEELEAQLKTMDIDDSEKEKMRKERAREEMAFLRARRRPMSEADFEILNIIGRGAFGEVFLVRHKTSGEYYAMKKLRKADMLRQEQVNHAWSERHVLIAADHPFVCKLCFAFQNNVFLHLVMEFLPGGDLMTRLIARDTLTEDEARFYIAETIVAIDSIHKLGFIHRDIKPDNLLLDHKGHVKLSDFGLCKSFQLDIAAVPATNSSATTDAAKSELRDWTMSERAAAWKSARKQAFSTVGTPNYVSYEVLMKRGYNKECDYWSLGVVLYEMLVGCPPFHAGDTMKTCRKILNWRETLRFPREAKISMEAKHLILSLVCDPKDRLGAEGGIDDFRSHPFFEGIDWDNLLSSTPPFVPELDGPTDVRYFEEYQPSPHGAAENEQQKRASYRKEPTAEEFIGFTFKRYNPHEASPGARAGLQRSIFDSPEAPAS